MNIIVSGMITADPRQGGATWAVLQYILGFKRLGHDVYFIEPVPPNSLRPAGVNLSASENAKYFWKVMEEFKLLDRAALLPAFPFDASKPPEWTSSILPTPAPKPASNGRAVSRLAPMQ